MEEKEVTAEEIVENITENHNKENRKQNRQLATVLIIGGVIAVAFLLWIFLSNSMANFEFRGTGYSVLQEGNLTFYQTKFRMISGGEHVADYNIYIRNDPRDLEEIPFEGDLRILPKMIINSTGEFACEGDGVIALANFASVLTALGTEVGKNESAVCGNSEYMFVQILPGEETKITQTGNACYNFYVNNCEILPVTEKFVVDFITELNI